jgi:sulfite exporter TauE/SafE
MTEITLANALLLGFILGMRHALDADHVVAVATFVSRHSSVLRSSLTGLSWGIGHTLSLAFVGGGILAFKLTIPERLALSLEFVVGVVLVLLGAPLVWRLVTGRAHVHLHRHRDRLHLHAHDHQEATEHRHRHLRKPLLVGMVHGLAGSGALTLMVVSALSSLAQGLIFLLVFGVGSILGMLLFSGLLSFPLKLASGFSPRLGTWIQAAAGVGSVAFGALIMFQVAFVQGLFLPGT